MSAYLATCLTLGAIHNLLIFDFNDFLLNCTANVHWGFTGPWLVFPVRMLSPTTSQTHWKLSNQVTNRVAKVLVEGPQLTHCWNQLTFWPSSCALRYALSMAACFSSIALFSFVLLLALVGLLREHVAGREADERRHRLDDERLRR